MIAIRKVLTVTGIALASLCLPALAANNASESRFGDVPAPQSINYHDLPGPDTAALAAALPNASSEYRFLFIGGVGFSPRTSSQRVSYFGGGCIGSNGWVNTDVQLPHGAKVIGVRVYYHAPASESMRTGLGVSDGAGSTIYPIFDSTLQSGGSYYSDYYSPSVVTLIDNGSHAYSLSAGQFSSDQVWLCGMRVNYQLP